MAAQMMCAIRGRVVSMGCLLETGINSVVLQVGNQKGGERRNAGLGMVVGCG